MKGTGTTGQRFARLPVLGKVLVGVLVVILVNVLYYFSIHMPLVAEIEDGRRHADRLEGNEGEARTRHGEYIRLREELSRRQALDRTNLRILPDEAEMPAFLQDLNRVAERSGLQIRVVEPRPEEPEEHYVRLPVVLHLSGRYHQLGRFFHNISQLDRAISMENIQLERPRLDGEHVVLDVEVLATTFRRLNTEEARGAS